LGFSVSPLFVFFVVRCLVLVVGGECGVDGDGSESRGEGEVGPGVVGGDFGVSDGLGGEGVVFLGVGSVVGDGDVAVDGLWVGGVYLDVEGDGVGWVYFYLSGVSPALGDVVGFGGELVGCGSDLGVCL